MAASDAAKSPLPTLPECQFPLPPSESTSQSTESDGVSWSMDTLLPLDLASSETFVPCSSPVPWTSNTLLALDLASSHNCNPVGPPVPLTSEALFTHDLSYRRISMLGSARPPAIFAEIWPSSSASTSHDDDAETPLTPLLPSSFPDNAPPQLPAPFPSFRVSLWPPTQGATRTYIYHDPVIPPVMRWFPSLANYQHEIESDLIVQRAAIDALYPRDAIMASEDRMQWEREFMGYFCWAPWSRRSGLELVKWVEDHGYDFSWTSKAKLDFQTATQNGYPHKKYYPEMNQVLDDFTYRTQRALVRAGIFNLAVARIHPDYYIVVPIGYSRPVYNFRDFSPVACTFITTWYPYAFLVLATIPGDDEAKTFSREFLRLVATLRSYYTVNTPIFREVDI